MFFVYVQAFRPVLDGPTPILQYVLVKTYSLRALQYSALHAHANTCNWQTTRTGEHQHIKLVPGIQQQQYSGVIYIVVFFGGIPWQLAQHPAVYRATL